MKRLDTTNILCEHACGIGQVRPGTGWKILKPHSREVPALLGKRKAEEIWRRHGLTIPVDLRLLVAELDLQIVTFPFRGRIKEMIVEGVVGVRPGLPRRWFRWYVAHAIGHHVMHLGTSFYLESWQWVSQAKAERQAEEFAARLLGGPDGQRRTASELGIPGEKRWLLERLAGRD